jgi:hypothetical protein
MPDHAKGLEIALPRVPSSDREKRKAWRNEVLARASDEAHKIGFHTPTEGRVEIVVVFYLQAASLQEASSEWPDIDNLPKDLHDALQGACGRSAKGITKHESRDPKRILRSDKQVYRVVAEKHYLPSEGAGGRLIVRPYVKHDWPLR